jgi:hypothetical protein
MPAKAPFQPVQFDPTASQPGSRVYYLLWRPRPSQPWQSEEHFSRSDAHNRYFSLVQRGYEAYLEKRDRLAMPG